MFPDRVDEETAMAFVNAMVISIGQLADSR